MPIAKSHVKYPAYSPGRINYELHIARHDCFIGLENNYKKNIFPNLNPF